METVVYLLCALTSAGCMFLLLTNYRKTRARLLLWGGLCFGCFAASNLLLLVDFGLLPQSVDLSYYRDGLTLIGLLLFIYGLIWEAS